MEAVVEAYLGTKQVRLGPRPVPEALVAIRQVVREAIREQRAIPILIASASLKLPLGKELDVAELGMLKQLASLQHRVRQHYDAGVEICIRMEDLTELILTPGRADPMVRWIVSIVVVTGLVAATYWLHREIFPSTQATDPMDSYNEDPHLGI